MSLEQIVDVTISRQTQVPTEVGFGVAAFLSADATITEATSYASMSEITAASSDVGADSVAFCTVYFGQSVAPEKIVIIPDGDGTLAEALDAAVQVDNDWYVLASATKTTADIALISTWVQSHANDNPKLYMAQTAEAAVLDGNDATDPASVAQAANNDRTIVAYKEDSEEFVAAWLGKLLPTKPGSTIWAFKTLAGITADALTATELGAAFEKKANVYQKIGGVSMTNNGTSATEYIDVMRGIDWLTSTITTSLFGYMINEPKIPYTDAGVAAIKANIQESLSLGVSQGVLAGEIEVSAPLVTDVSAANKGNRVLPDVSFSGVLAGAIQKVTINGTVTL